MIDLTTTGHYKRIQRQAELLTDALLWIDAFHTSSELADQILEWIKEDQLEDKGVDSNDENIGFYSFMTEILSDGEKQEGDHYTLDDTGEFKQTMVVLALADVLVIKADADKMQNQHWWRDEILGLNNENMSKLRDAYREKVINYGKRVLAGRI